MAEAGTSKAYLSVFWTKSQVSLKSLIISPCCVNQKYTYVRGGQRQPTARMRPVEGFIVARKASSGKKGNCV